MEWKRRTAWVLVAAILGCGYQSTYVPPDGDRYRVVWRRDRLVVVGPTTLDACEDAGIGEHPARSSAAPSAPARSGVWWVAHGDDDEDDEDDGIEGLAAAIVAVVLVSTVVTGTTIGLAFAPAGRAQASAQALYALADRNRDLKRAQRKCERAGDEAEVGG